MAESKNPYKDLREEQARENISKRKKVNDPQDRLKQEDRDRNRVPGSDEIPTESEGGAKRQPS